MARKKLSPKYFVGCLVIVLSACGSEQPAVKDSKLRLDLIEQAMDAVDAAVGEDQAYFEINVTDSVVNLFLATDLDGQPNPDGLPDAMVQYVFTPQDGLEDVALPLAANGPTFTRSAVNFSVEKVLLIVVSALPNSTAKMFVIAGVGTASGSTGVADYRVRMNSSQGGEMSVLVTKDGEIIGTDAS